MNIQIIRREESVFVFPNAPMGFYLTNFGSLFIVPNIRNRYKYFVWDESRKHWCRQTRTGVNYNGYVGEKLRPIKNIYFVPIVDGTDHQLSSVGDTQARLKKHYSHEGIAWDFWYNEPFIMMEGALIQIKGNIHTGQLMPQSIMCDLVIE